MDKSINNLHTLHAIRHSFVMYAIVKDRSSDVDLAWRNLVSIEMKLFVTGVELLAEERYNDYVEWFFNNTPPTVIEDLKPLCQKIVNEIAEPAIDPDDIPF